jgi:hypothetical protein
VKCQKESENSEQGEESGEQGEESGEQVGEAQCHTTTNAKDEERGYGCGGDTSLRLDPHDAPKKSLLTSAYTLLLEKTLDLVTRTCLMHLGDLVSGTRPITPTVINGNDSYSKLILCSKDETPRSQSLTQDPS